MHHPEPGRPAPPIVSVILLKGAPCVSLESMNVYEVTEEMSGYFSNRYEGEFSYVTPRMVF